MRSSLQKEKEFERDKAHINYIYDWVSEIEQIETIRDKFTNDVQLYIILKEPLPNPYNVSDDRFKKVFLYLKNSVHKGMWRIKNMESNRKEIICENNKSSDGTNISWELELEIAETQKINETTMEIEEVEEPHVVVVKQCEINHDHPAMARLTPPLLINCRATVLSISCISLVDQSFVADVQCTFTARDVGQILKNEVDDNMKALRNQMDVFDIEKAVSDFASYYEFQKAIGFRHCRDKLDEEQSAHVSLGETDINGNYRYNYVFTYRRNGIYNSSFDLRMYPFDEQKLCIAIIFNLDQYSAKLTENYKSRSTFLHKNFHLHDIFEVVQDQRVNVDISFSDPAFSSVKASYSVVEYSVVLRRKYSYFIGNFILPIMMITGLSLTSFDTRSFEERLQIISSLWLTIVTYKLMLVDILPPISYFTFLNYYIIFCFFYVALVAFTNLYPEDNTPFGVEEERIERYFLSVLFIAAHLIAFGFLHFHIFSKRQQESHRLRMYEEKIKSLLETIKDGTKRRTIRQAAVTIVASVKLKKCLVINRLHHHEDLEIPSTLPSIPIEYLSDLRLATSNNTGISASMTANTAPVTLPRISSRTRSAPLLESAEVSTMPAIGCARIRKRSQNDMSEPTEISRRPSKVTKLV